MRVKTEAPIRGFHFRRPSQTTPRRSALEGSPERALHGAERNVDPRLLTGKVEAKASPKYEKGLSEGQSPLKRRIKPFVKKQEKPLSLIQRDSKDTMLRGNGQQVTESSKPTDSLDHPSYD